MAVSAAKKREWLLALLETNEGPLTRYAARILGDVERGRDVVQESFLRLWKTDPVDVGPNPAAWLYTVCRNLSFDVLRKEQRMVTLASDDVPQLAAPAAQDGMEQQETMSPVLEALQGLPPNQQEVIRLKFQSGLSYKDISRITGHSVSNVGFLIHAGVKTLRQALAASGAPATKSSKGGVK